MKKMTLQELANNMGGYVSINKDESVLFSERKPVANKELGEWVVSCGNSCLVTHVNNLKKTDKVWNHSICKSN